MKRETFDCLRRAALSLAIPVRERRLPAVVFTSPGHGHGTSTMTHRIAHILMEGHGVHPLVIELDTERPRFCRDYRLDESRTIRAVVEQGMSVQEAAQTTPSGVPVLAADPAGDGAITIDSLTGIIKAAQNRFNLVMIDAPPIPRHADAMMAAMVTRSVILVVAARQTTQEMVLQVKSELEQRNVLIQGAILNRARPILPRWLDRRC